MQRVLLLIALVAAMAVDGFFALVNFYPVAPRRSRGPERYVYAELDRDQTRWFQSNVLDAFNDAHNVNVILRRVTSEQLINVLSRDRAAGRPALLALLPTEIAAAAAGQSAVEPVDQAVPAAILQRDLAGLRREVVVGAQVAGRQWFVPGVVVLDVAVYRISRVHDAEMHWGLVRPQIEAALRTVNGRGLPAGYQLEHDPAGWDAYDQFVLAYYWTHRSYDGTPARARVAHRAGASPDALFDIAAGIYRQGGSDTVLGRYDTDAARDYFQWEALYRQEGMYAPEMFQPGGLDDEGVQKGLRDGDFYLSDVDQMEAFTLHGGSRRGASPQVDAPDDLGFMALPRGASLELDARGHPRRSTGTFSFREESVWALPKGGADPALAYALVQFILTRENHYRSCEALGMLPFRTDVVRDRASIFRLAWMSQIFDAGYAQWPRSEIVPAELVSDGHGARLAELWDRIVAGMAAGPAEPAALARLLRSATPAESTPRPGPAPTATRPTSAGATDGGLATPPGGLDEGLDDHGPFVSSDAWRSRVVLQWNDAGTEPARDASDAGGEDGGATAHAVRRSQP